MYSGSDLLFRRLPMSTSTHGPTGTTRLSERQMRNWSLKQEIGQRIENDGAHRFSTQIQPFIAISREAGAGATEVVQCLATRLNWPVLDREVLDSITHDFHLSRRMLESVDEHAPNWVYDTLFKWMDHNIVTHQEYMGALRTVLLRATRERSHIIKGRGAAFLLPRYHGVAVRLVAPLHQRIERIMGRFHWSATHAEEHIILTDRDREAYIRSQFRKEPSDPHGFDLIINMEFYTAETAADLIIDQYQRRFLGS
ncbi:hypothetical protein GC176_26345 [bacterium]|nr:hypothetical protein [bacterium]